MDIICWNSKTKDARGWLVIDRLINGVCGGGTFMHSNATLEEVKLLAATMTKKNQLNDLPFGGAKAGIRFDHNNPEACDVLKEFLEFCKHYLKTCWSTGADLNTNSEEIEQIISSLGISSGFFAIGQMYAKNLNIPNQCNSVRSRVSLQVDEYLTLENTVIGYVNANITKQFLHQKTAFDIAIQGFGSVGKSIAYYMEKLGVARIVAIIDETGFLLSDNGLSIRHLIKLAKNNPRFKTLKELYNLYVLEHDCIFHDVNFIQNSENLINFMQNIKVDIVAFCANRFVIDTDLVDMLSKYTFSESREKILIFGANLPFVDDNSEQYATKKNIKFLPCWFSSSGNSLLYAKALSCRNIGTNWQNETLQNITQYLIRKSYNLWNIPFISNNQL